MMNWLKKLFNKNKSQKYNQEEMLRVEKQNYRTRKEYIDNFFEEFQEQESIKKRAYQDKINDENYQHNSKCPKCKSNNIIQIYKRCVGEINESYHDKTLHGTLDTDKVNQCKSCGHEFEYKKQCYIWSDDYYDDKINIKPISYLFLAEIGETIEKLNKFNPNKLTEESNTIEEKKIQLSKKLKEHRNYVTIINYPIEIIIYAALEDGFYRFPKCEEIINFGKYEKDDVRNYMTKLTPQAHDLMVNYLGFKYHFN